MVWELIKETKSAKLHETAYHESEIFVTAIISVVHI